MPLSKESIDALSDLIQNKLMMMHIGDRDDLRERITLQRALSELHGPDEVRDGMINRLGVIPNRGRRRKVCHMVDEHGELA